MSPLNARGSLSTSSARSATSSQSELYSPDTARHESKMRLTTSRGMCA